MSEGTIPRLFGPRRKERQRLFPAVALLGPRQVGKTTPARAIADAGGGHPRRSRMAGLYLDLESPADQERLTDAQGYLRLERDRHAENDRYPKGGGVEAIGVRTLAEELAR